MIHIKPGVRVHGIRPEIVLAIQIAAAVYDQFGESLTVTSVIDGKHIVGSLHYVGAAVDFRLPGLGRAKRIASRLRDALAGDYDVIIGADNLHVEFQPKKAY